jgi:predicted ATPase
MEPTAFRIQDFKSIKDSGVCTLSADGITVLAGENESGKTAVLQALRDFDAEPGTPSNTSDYLPDDDLEKKPRVSVRFKIDWSPIVEDFRSEAKEIPPKFLETLRNAGEIWIHRDLPSGSLSLDKGILSSWSTDSSEKAATAVDASGDEADVSDKSENREIVFVSPEDLLSNLYRFWPSFVYFSSFDDLLPKRISFERLIAPQPEEGSATPALAKKPGPPPRIVLDFLSLAGVDLQLIKKHSDNEKVLANYLAQRNATITDDFLNFWHRDARKREGKKGDSISLRVKHSRDDSGNLFLNFYVHDTSDQYPEQRSKGFLWFLSFYLRLAASNRSGEGRESMLLIDEPGTFLHARAQRDILRLFEERLVDRDTIVYSTHSPYLLPPEKLYRLRVVLKTPGEGTKLLDKLTDVRLTGQEFSDVLSPVLTAIGIDIHDQLKLVAKKNIVVEGISDFFYLHAWRQLLNPAPLAEVNIFPGTGASSTTLLSALFIGWGVTFVVALDHDEEGNAIKKKLVEEMGIPTERVLQPPNACSVEDLFSPNDFNHLLKELGPQYKLNAGEKPSKAINRMGLQKPLVARTFAALARSGTLNPTQTTVEAVKGYLEKIEEALNYEPSLS